MSARSTARRLGGGTTREVRDARRFLVDEGEAARDQHTPTARCILGTRAVVRERDTCCTTGPSGARGDLSTIAGPAVDVSQ